MIDDVRRACSRKAGFALAVVTLTAMMAGASAPSPFYPVLAARIGFDTVAITAVFAVYAGALLLTLLTAGSLSDHVGRRPVTSGALVLLAASIVVFWHADTVAWLLVARVIQGVASGLLLSSLSATVTDFEPPSRPGAAAVWNAVAPMVGLASGALVSGLLLDNAGDAMAWVFAPLALLYLVLAVAAWFVPESAARRPGALASLRLRFSVPRHMRALFLQALPAIFAGWATGGLFLSLGASIVRTEFGGVAHIWQGLSVALLAASGALSIVVARRFSARSVTIYGTSALAVGTGLSLVALSAGSLVGYLAAVLVAGTGFGTGFFGVVRLLIPHIPAAERADVFASIFLASYTAFGLPAVIAGISVELVGLTPVVYGYGVVVIVLASAAAVLRWREKTAG